MSFISLENASRRQLAIMGVVVDGETLETVRGARVAITAMPAAFQDFLDRRALRFGPAWEAFNERPDRTRSGADGSFAFADLPDGTYTVTVSMPGAPHRYGAAQKTYTVTRDASGTLSAVASPPGTLIDIITLPATGVRGVVTGSLSGGPPNPLLMARLVVRGSGEQAFTDDNGSFYLTGVELGARVVEVIASGFVPLSTVITFVSGVVSQQPDIVLQQAP